MPSLCKRRQLQTAANGDVIAKLAATNQFRLFTWIQLACVCRRRPLGDFSREQPAPLWNGTCFHLVILHFFFPSSSSLLLHHLLQDFPSCVYPAADFTFLFLPSASFPLQHATHCFFKRPYGVNASVNTTPRRLQLVEHACAPVFQHYTIIHNPL